ncbi:MAG: asparagine synthase (glutamine-hydrolyzing) [Acidimicrobiales bacterium]
MCGIAGLLVRPGPRDEELTAQITRMTATLSHRGPDDQGVWVAAEQGIALGNRRLAVIDPSPDGRQPMASRDDRYRIVFNGEVYNFASIRAQLEAVGTRFRGRSDTEVLVEAISVWGLRNALDRVNGMFAIGLWDSRQRTLTLARDRFGEKPLYYSASRGTVTFGSELRALRASPGFEDALDHQALLPYLRTGCIPAPLTIYETVAKVRPGELIEISAGPSVRSETWWSASERAGVALADPIVLDPGGIVHEVNGLLQASVDLRSVADVSLGAFMSGGIDSACVASLLAGKSEAPVKTFTIGFEDVAFDEADAAAEFSHHLGTDHSVLRVGPQQAAAVVDQLPGIYDEPFADSSQLPTLLVCRLAREQVTVVLSGDGGDELFGGYNRHARLEPLWNRISRIPQPLRSAMSSGILTGSPALWESIMTAMGPALPASLRVRHPGDKAHKLAGVLAAGSPEEAYRSLTSYWPDPRRVLTDPDGGAPEVVPWSFPGDLTDQVMLADTTSYLPDDQLTKLDRASMSAGLEARVPLLDHRLFELTWRLRRCLRSHPGPSKWPLRQILNQRVPASAIDRPKSGFAFPLAKWLRGPLRPWAEDLLDVRSIQAGGLLDPKPVRDAWAEHLAGRFDRSDQLWTVLMLEAWRRQHHSSSPR